MSTSLSKESTSAASLVLDVHQEAGWLSEVKQCTVLIKKQRTESNIYVIAILNSLKSIRLCFEMLKNNEEKD